LINYRWQHSRSDILNGKLIATLIRTKQDGIQVVLLVINGPTAAFTR
jgi:hypothetical protein